MQQRAINQTIKEERKKFRFFPDVPDFYSMIEHREETLCTSFIDPLVLIAVSRRALRATRLVYRTELDWW